MTLLDFFFFLLSKQNWWCFMSYALLGLMEVRIMVVAMHCLSSSRITKSIRLKQMLSFFFSYLIKLLNLVLYLPGDWQQLTLPSCLATPKRHLKCLHLRQLFKIKAFTTCCVYCGLFWMKQSNTLAETLCYGGKKKRCREYETYINASGDLHSTWSHLISNMDYF